MPFERFRRSEGCFALLQNALCCSKSLNVRVESGWPGRIQDSKFGEKIVVPRCYPVVDSPVADRCKLGGLDSPAEHTDNTQLFEDTWALPAVGGLWSLPANPVCFEFHLYTAKFKWTLLLRLSSGELCVALCGESLHRRSGMLRIAERSKPAKFQ